jgi:DNA-binding NtrC family response regulator
MAKEEAIAQDGALTLSGLHDWLRLVLTYRAPHPDSERILTLIEHLLDRPHRAHMLLYGEPGTGKEGLARALHQAMHAGGDSPFIKMPTGGRNPEVLALHLFGTRERRGAITRAEGGTLFLDEVGTLPREIQARLAPVLRGRFRRNDDEAPQPCQVTVIGATDHDIEAAVAEGRFRHDLYYRLSRGELTIPPLRERDEDIPRAALWAGNRLLKESGESIRLIAEGEEADEGDIVLTEAAAEVLRAHGWAGNFRELDRLMERLLFLTERRAELDEAMVRGALEA